MSMVITGLRLARHARKGIGLRNKKLAWMTAALGVIGPKRNRAREMLIRRIQQMQREGVVDLKLHLNGKPAVFSMRHDNIDDFKIAGELVRGAYPLPDFIPATIIDGGANIGMFAIYASAHFPTARITCFEPEPDNFRQLQRNIALNGLNVQAMNLGLWSGRKTLYFQKRTSYAGFVSDEPSDIAVECELPPIGEDCWLKLDIEGAEYEVIPAIIQSGQLPRWITMEIHDFARRGRGLVKLLTDRGYDVAGADCPDHWDSTVIAARLKQP